MQWKNKVKGKTKKKRKRKRNDCVRKHFKTIVVQRMSVPRDSKNDTYFLLLLYLYVVFFFFFFNTTVCDLKEREVFNAIPHNWG